MIGRCLDRDVKTRLRDIGEARLTIGRYLADPASGEVPGGVRSARQWGAWAAAAILAVLAIVGWLRPQPEASSPTADLVLTIAPAEGGLARVGDIHATPEISPDGTAVIFYQDGVHLRRLNQLTPEPVLYRPFHQSRILVPRLAIVRVYRRDQPEEDARAGRRAGNCDERRCRSGGGSWSSNGTLLVATPSGLYASAAGGVAKRIDSTGTPFERGGVAWGYSWPEFLPGSEDFLVLVDQGIEQSDIYLATLRDGRAADPVLLMKNATAARIRRRAEDASCLFAMTTSTRRR